MASKTFRILLSSTFEDSEKVPDFVASVQEESGLQDDKTDVLMLVLSEAVTNAIVHGNKENPDKKVTVDVVVKPDKIIAEITDEGEGFTPNQTHDPLDEENLLNQSGRGIFLMDELCDQIEYFKDGTQVRLTLQR